jgi:uncharacterized cupin superfamily protein
MDHVNESDLDWSELDRNNTHFRRKQLAEAAGGERVGCSLYELPPESRSWPCHYHTGNEEAIFILSGTGLLRGDDGRHGLEAGDYVALPVGEEGAHRVINDSSESLQYLAVSTMQDPDVPSTPTPTRSACLPGRRRADTRSALWRGSLSKETPATFETSTKEPSARRRRHRA